MSAMPQLNSLNNFQPQYQLSFPSLAEDDREYLMAQSRSKRFKKNHPVVSQGEDGSAFFLILSGEVEVFVEAEDKRTLLCRLGPGEFFGELALLTGGPRTASVVTTCDSELAVIGTTAFRNALDARPTLWLFLVRQLVMLVRDLTEKVALSPLKAYERLRHHLYRLAVERDGQLVIEGHWTHVHFAELVGCVRENIVKIFGELRRGGWIAYDEEGRLIILKNLPKSF